jgi:polar amino acid transport system permease protein
MTERVPVEPQTPSLPQAVRRVWILVGITALLSLLYALQFFLGSPIRLAVVSEIHDLALNPDRTVAAVGAQDGNIYLWEIPAQIRTNVPRDFDIAQEPLWTRHRLSGQRAPVIEIEFVDGGSNLLSVDASGAIRRSDVAGALSDRNPGEAVADLALQSTPLIDAAFGADGAVLATLESDGAVRVWDLATGQVLREFGPGEGPRQAVALDAGGALVAAGNGSTIDVWRVDSGEVVHQLVGRWENPDDPHNWLGHEKEVTALAISSDLTTLASGSADTTIVFWDLESGNVAADSEGHWATVTVMVFDEEGRSLLTGGKDNKTRNLRLPGGKSTAIFEGHLNTIHGVAFGPQPDTIFTASADGTMRVWETANQKAVHIEWTRYGFQPGWGRTLAIWLLISGLLGLLCLWGLVKLRIWSHLFGVGLYLLGPIVILGLPLFEALTYPIAVANRLQIAWPLMVLLAWYVVVLAALLHERVAHFYESPLKAPLAEKLVISQQTVKTRFGIFSLAVWLGLLVIVYSVLRRFNLDIAFMGHYLEFIMAGSGLTVVISAASIVLAVILALLGALGRLSKNPIANGISSFYISLIRGTPLLVQIFIWYLGLPRLGLILQPMMAGILALGVNYGAYMTEIFRAGIQAIGKGQYEAAEALGMTRGQTFQRIVLPQAFRIVIPPIGNEFIAMMKDSSLVSVMSIWELTYRAQKIGRQNFRNLETFLIAAAFYWILTVIFQALQSKLEEHMGRSERR